MEFKVTKLSTSCAGLTDIQIESEKVCVLLKLKNIPLKHLVLKSRKTFERAQELNEKSYCMIGLCHLMAGDDSRMAGGESRMTGDCCRPEGSIHRCVRTHSHLYSYIYGLVALLDNIQSSFSSITISTNLFAKFCSEASSYVRNVT